MIESTDVNFGTHEKVVIPITVVTCNLPIPMVGICAHLYLIVCMRCRVYVTVGLSVP